MYYPESVKFIWQIRMFSKQFPDLEVEAPEYYASYEGYEYNYGYRYYEKSDIIQEGLVMEHGKIPWLCEYFQYCENTGNENVFYQEKCKKEQFGKIGHKKKTRQEKEIRGVSGFNARHIKTAKPDKAKYEQNGNCPESHNARWFYEEWEIKRKSHENNQVHQENEAGKKEEYEIGSRSHTEDTKI